MRKLSRTWERIRNVPGLGNDIVAFTVLFVLGLVAGGYILSQYDWEPPWEDRVRFAAELEKAPGVFTDAVQEVRIAGVTVGKVESAEPLPGEKARLTMSLEEGHTVYDNARLVWRMKAPINVMYVTLDPGGPPGKPLPEDGVIPAGQTERAIQPFELLDKLDERTQSALTALLNQADTALADAPAQLPEGLAATDGTIASFKPVIDKLHTRREYIERLVTAVSRISTAAGGDQQRLASLTSSLHSTLNVLAQRDGELRAALQTLPGFVDDLDEAMRKTGTLTDELDPTLDSLESASDKLPQALRRVTDTARTTGDVVKKASPVVAKAKPVVADLRPLTADVNSALGDLAPVTGHLPKATGRIVPWLDHLAAFVYQTSSAFSLADVNGGYGRANVVMDLSNPTGGGDGATPPERKEGE
ncbi:MCE family protein [Haloechinothrix salitolerans]|uniref:MCE family protein n=1 Tax=Haloechinothrix salitolerans TaxID=926830 RepID=A0ABW2C3M2_9PSEU